MKKNWINDVLRDKGSSKYSITKSIALIFTLLLSIYILWVGLYKGNEVDHVLVIELLGTILTLTVFKNNFGLNKTTETSTSKNEIKIIKEERVDDEGNF